MYKIDYRAMGKRIRQKRKEMDLTQEKLAELVDISPSHVGEIERGTSVCSVEVLVNLATALGLNLDTLVKGIDDKNVDNAFSELLGKMPNNRKDLYIKLCENIADTLK